MSADVYEIECVVVGAGVVGLACARALAESGREVLVLEGERVAAGQVVARLVEDDALSRGELEQLRGLIESRLGGDAGATTPVAALAEAPAAEEAPGAAGPTAARSAKSCCSPVRCARASW